MNRRRVRVVLGQFPHHPGLLPSATDHIIPVVSHIMTEAEDVFDRAQLHGLWVSESVLPWWLGADEIWPTPAMIVAAGQWAKAGDVAAILGERLKQDDICGVWGQRLGCLSDVSLPWIGSRLRRVVQEGFRQAGVRSAWVRDAAGTTWQFDDGRIVVPESSAREWWEPTWTHLGAEDGSPTRENHAPVGTLSTPSMAPIVAQIRTDSIVLVDDPLVLPLRTGTTMVLTGFLPGSPALDIFSRNFEVRQDARGTGEGKSISVYRDCLPRHNDPFPVVLGFRQPAVIAQAPKHAVKILLFDDHPDTWAALARKLLGKEPWTGRVPIRLDTDAYRAEHAQHYATEMPYPGDTLRWLESRPDEDILNEWIQEEVRSMRSVTTAFPQIEQVIHWVVAAIASNHRVFYIGAGSAGRAGVIDAVELPPTFGVDPTQVQGILAGGDVAIKKAREGVEDDFAQGQQDMIGHDVGAGDVVIALSAHGDTPYVLGALEEAMERRAHTAVIVNNQGTRAAQKVDAAIFVDSGPEILVGSTRLKAGTSEKIILNMISTVAMIRLGKSYDNLMVDFVATNQKLKERAVRVFMLATGEPRRHAQDCLHNAQGHLPRAIIMNRLQTDLESATLLLQRYGSIAEVLRHAMPREAPL